MSGELKNIADVIRYLDDLSASKADSGWIEGFTIGCAASGIISDNMASELQQIYRVSKKHTGVNDGVNTCVNMSGPVHISEISRITGYSRQQVHNALYQLQKQKRVKNLGKSTWKSI
ncbi:MAG: hypothetical protein KKD77_21180 [Gammaproteobacteria bacterium]|nr:hypothetical protein [Gammaproteobacteria bacterium]